MKRREEKRREEKRREEKGNALFLILIAVALFAALSYAITWSGRGSGGVNKEQALLDAVRITQAGTAFQTAVLRMSLITGISVSTIKTGTATAPWLCCPGEPGNDFCTAGSNCLFAPEGGNMTIPDVPRAAFLPSPPLPVMNWAVGFYFTGPGGFNGIEVSPLNIVGVGTAADDYTVAFQPLTEDVCAQINRGLGISGIPVGNGFGSVAGNASGKRAACFDYGGAGDSQYTYYEVIVAN